MNVLLDTHAFLWFVNGDVQLSERARTTIENPENQPYLSAASVWEMAIKMSLGKLHVDQPLDDFVGEQMRINGIAWLDLTLSHAAIVSQLPFHHRDPFDRLLVAQSQAGQMPLLSRDTVLDLYGITRIW